VKQASEEGADEQKVAAPPSGEGTADEPSAEPAKEEAGKDQTEEQPDA
jgi:hypothetical protein